METGKNIISKWANLRGELEYYSGYLMKTTGRNRTVKSVRSTWSLAGHKCRLDEECLQ